MSNPTADWDRVGDGYYRKVQLYTSVFDPDLELGNHHVCGAPYSGALALYRLEDKLFSYRGGDGTKSSIDIYSCAGKLIERINWTKGPIRGIGWSEDEELIVVSQDGSANLYTGLSSDFVTFTLGREAEEHGVAACRFWLTGFVALLGNNQVVSVARYDDPRPRVLATPPSDEVIAWTVIPPAYTLSRTVEVLLSIGQTINVVDASDSEDRMLQNGPFRHICVSPNGRFIALYTDDGKVWVISSDFQEKLSEYSTNVKTRPKDMQWCGNDSVVLAWDDEVHVVGPNGAALKYEYDGWVHLAADVDGVRIFTGDSCEFLQKVPDATEDTFKFGSTAPSSILLEAVNQLDKKSPKADEDIQLIKPNLVDAIDVCIDAAGHEFSMHWQKQLLRAASFGKSILELYDSDRYVEMCQSLRVLNAVRFYEVGLPISYEQYMRLSPERLIQRLVTRKEYLLALRLSEYLRLPTDSVYVHWASQKARVSTEDDETVCERIVQKVNGKPGISFEEIARAAHKEGRQRLATALLNHEPRAGKQVPLLLDMEEDMNALDKAIDSGDTDLMRFVLHRLQAKLPRAAFFRNISTRPVASALVESSALEQDREQLKDLYYQDDRRVEGSNLLFAEALQQPDTQAKSDKLRLAAKVLQDAKGSTFQSRSIDELQRLLRLQDALDSESAGADSQPGARRFRGLSVNEVLFELVRTGNHKRAAKVYADFKVPERTFWWIRLRALVAKRDWRELEETAGRSKKSPIGWEPFFNEVLGAGNGKLAAVFVAKCTTLSPKERVEMYLKCGMVARAGEEALKAKDRQMLEDLRAKATGGDATEIERMIGMLTKGR